MKKQIIGCMAVLIIVLELTSCRFGKGVSLTATPDTTQLTTPGKSLLFMVRLLHDDSIVLKAGETNSLDIVLETRKDGPGRVAYTVSRVTGEYSEERLPLPKELEVNTSPASFVAEPDNTYTARLTLKTSPELAIGAYYLLLQCEFENVFRSKGWIKVDTSDK